MASKTASAGAKVPALDSTVEDPGVPPASVDDVAVSMDLDPGTIRAASEDALHRHRLIPREGIPVPEERHDALAVWMGLDSSALLAAQVYPDRVVAVTHDGRKIEKAAL